MNLQKSWALSLAATLGATLALSGCENGEDSGPFNAPVVVNSYAITSSNRLLSFDTGFSAHANAAAISGIGAGETIVGSATRPASGALYVLTRNGTSGKVYSINTSSGAATNGVALTADAADTTAPYTGLAGTAFGVDFNPVPDRLRVVSSTGQNLRINVDTGATTTDTNLNGADTVASGAAYTNAFGSACRTALYVIDPATDTLYLQNPPNDGVLQKIGALGVDVSAVGGLDIRTAADGSNTLFGALTVGGTSQLYSISTLTGAASPLGAFDTTGGETIVGFSTDSLPTASAAGITQAAGELIGLNAAGALVSFNRGSPAKLCTTAAVAGIDSGDSLVGIDLRPSDGKVYGLGKLGSLYTVTTAGAATKACSLVADPADATLPYAGLTGGNFGVNFNPVPDRLRVVADNAQNLRINPTPNASTQCLVTTDAVLTGGTTPSVTAASYTNAIPGAGSTALYGIDTGSDSLVRIGTDPATGGACPGDTGNPNCGVVTSVGSLGITGDVAATAGLEIDGKTGTAFGAFAAGAATSSTLYTVNLGTGAATPAGVIGGGSILKSLTLNLNSAVKVYGLTSDGHLLSFGLTANVFTPNTVTDVTITGLATGDKLVGIDVRPLNGLLYAVGTSGRLYTVNTSTGAATAAVTLTADPADTTAPIYTSLNPTAVYGVNFNPTVDRLRVVNDANDNFRINPFTGIVIGDGAINGGTGIVGAAYTNSFVGSTTTTLYDLNGTTLYRQAPPNDGTLVAVGTTGVTATGGIGFDIAGGSNGLVLAAIRTASGTGPSDLYRVNLTSGAATPIIATAGAATIGTATTQQLIGLAIEVK